MAQFGVNSLQILSMTSLWNIAPKPNDEQQSRLERKNKIYNAFNNCFHLRWLHKFLTLENMPLATGMIHDLHPSFPGRTGDV